MFIPAGIYLISVSIKVPSHVSLVGAGFDTVLVLADGLMLMLLRICIRGFGWMKI